MDIELVDVALAGVRRLVGLRHQEGAVHLQRCVGERAQKLELRVFLQRHQIQDQDLQWADVLGQRALFIHYEDIFLFKDRLCGQIILNANRHDLLFSFLSGKGQEILLRKDRDPEFSCLPVL